MKCHDSCAARGYVACEFEVAPREEIAQGLSMGLCAGVGSLVPQKKPSTPAQNWEEALNVVSMTHQ